MRGYFRYVKGCGDTNAILNAKIEPKRFEDIKDFKKRVKKHKYYSEDYILEDLYTYMAFSRDLIWIIEIQRKEIEELKKPKYIYNAETNEIKTLNNDLISKDKIRDIINNTEKNIKEDRPAIVLEYLILKIKELLEE